MVKHIFLFFIFLWFSKFTAQNRNIAVNYTEIISLGAPGANLKVYNASLFITKDKTLYVTKIDSLENGGKTITKTYKDKSGKIKGIRDFSTKKGIYNILDRESDTLYSNARFNYNFIYKEKRPKINWKIHSTEKLIENIKVRKATATFRGRNYIAWFAYEIPVSLGPWKLNGLPGLIIEAYDDKNEVQFLFKKLVLPYKYFPSIPSLDKNWVSYTAYLSEKKKHIERNLKYSRSLGQQFESQVSDDEIEGIKNVSFLEKND